MRKNKKLLGLVIFSAIIFSGCFLSQTVLAAEELSYAPLVDLKTGGAGTGGTINLADYVSTFFVVFQALIVFLAVVYITIGGIFLMMSGDNSNLNSKGKSYITEALWGLGIMLCANLILGTINPRLVSPNLLDFKEKITNCQLSK